MKLKGKRAIVTGASRGLGECIAEMFWREGAKVFMPLRKNYNLAIPEHADQLIGDSEPFLNGLDILVNCAGDSGPVGAFPYHTRAAVSACTQVNMLSPMILCSWSINLMIPAKTEGSIINISGGGACNPRRNFSAYAAAKGGLVAFSASLAAEVQQYGIRVNCVSPGLLNTRMGSPEGDPPDRAAQLVTWLASDDSRPVTGKLISAKWDDWGASSFKDRLVKDADYCTLRRVDR